jgi:phage tail-like protein
MLPKQHIKHFALSLAALLLIKKFMHPHPLPAFHFLVNWGGASSGFTEISGLSIEAEVIEYREGSSPQNNTIKMPGLQKFSNVTLKRGIVASDNDFFNWMNTVLSGQVERRDVTISLLNERREPVRVWKLRNAWPCKVQAGDLNASGNEVAVEIIELAHEGLTIEAS